MRSFQTHARTLALLALLSVTLAPALARAAAVDDDAVDRSIRRAINYLWSEWNEKECWDRAQSRDTPRNYGGWTALCAYALLAAGESHQSERMSKTIAWLEKQDLQHTYALAMRANVYAMLPQDKYRDKLRADVMKLVNSVNGLSSRSGPGGYHYDADGTQLAKGASGFDNSNSQYGVLGVWAGTRHNIEVPTEYWRLVERHWVSTQRNDGGWNYKTDPSEASYGTMTSAGVATLFVCFDQLRAGEFANCTGGTKLPAIEKGLVWLEKNFRTDDRLGLPSSGRGRQWQYYYLYGLERVGLACGYKYFGTTDWYSDSVQYLLRRQGADGRWGSGAGAAGDDDGDDGDAGRGARAARSGNQSTKAGEGNVPNRVRDTAFALLFLARGRHPVLFNKLEYDGDWDNRPRALANLTSWISRMFEREVNWQIVNLKVPVREWHDAPILYISGSRAPRMTVDDIAKMREYVLQGGTILSVAECGGTAFTGGMLALYKRMFPEYDLQPLPADHPIYSRQTHFEIARRVPIHAIGNGVRLLALHVSHDLPRSWQLNARATAAQDFELAANLYFHQTDRGSLRNRGMRHWPEATAGGSTPVRLARLKHAGNFDPEPLAWQRFAALMANHAGTKLQVGEPMEIADLKVEDYPIAHLTGTGPLQLTDEQRDALKAYAMHGGTLIIDAAGGNEAFRASAEAMLDGLFGSRSRRPLALSSEVYQLPGMKIEKVDYRRTTKLRQPGLREPMVEGIMADGRIVVLYSPHDLTAGLVGYQAFGIDGYAPGRKVEEDSAFQVMRNLVLWSAAQRKTAGR